MDKLASYVELLTGARQPQTQADLDVCLQARCPRCVDLAVDRRIRATAIQDRQQVHYIDQQESRVNLRSDGSPRLLVGLVVVTAGCSSSSGLAKMSTPAGDPSQASASGSPITIAQIVHEASQVGYVLKSDEQPAQAAIEHINVHGGIQGHPLKLKDCATALSINDAIPCASKSIGDKSVVALVATNDNESAQVGPLFDQAGLPLIGNLAVSPAGYTSKTSFPTGIGAMSNTGAAVLRTDQLHVLPFTETTDFEWRS